MKYLKTKIYLKHCDLDMGFALLDHRSWNETRSKHANC